MKKLLFLGFFNLFFSVSTVFAGNPIAYFSLDSNILDPGAYSTPWGGCGPMDSNCYTVKKASSPSILQNKNDQNNNQSVLTLNSNNNSSIIQNIKSSLNSNTSISNSALLSALRNLFTVGLPDDLLSKLQGPVGPVGPKGDSGLNISGGYTPIPVNYAPMGTIPSSSNFSGGTVLSSTFLSAKEFTSGTVNITDIATIATLNISKDSNITGNLSVGGTTTLGDASDDTTTINSGSWTFANDTNFALTGGINGLSFDTDTLSIDSTNHRIGIGTTSPTQKLDVSGNININTNGTSILFSSYKGADSDGDNIFIGGGGLSSVGVVGETYKGAKNTALGASSLYSNTTGYDNTAIGYQSLYNNTTGTYNVAVGNQALYSNTVGYDNIAIGYKALYSNVSGHSGVAIGFESQLNVDPATRAWTNYNTSIGFQSLRGSTTAAENIGDNNTAIGYQSLYSNSSGHRNTAIGSQSLLNNTTGTDNSAIGNSALYSNTTGSSNSAIGNSALYSNTTGSNNTALGHYAGRYLTDGLTGRVTGNNGLYIGYATKASADGTDNEIVIGASAIGAGSNSVTLGNDSITKTLLKGNVGIGTTSPPALLSVGSGTHETATFSVTGENSGTIANFRDEDGENIFKTSGSVAAGNLSVLFGDMDYAGNGNYFSVTGDKSYFMNGNVGIGTSTPSTKLEVFSATTPQFKISYDASNNSTLDTDASGYFTLNPSGGITNIGSSTGIDDNELRIYGYTTDNKYLSLTHTGSDALIEVSSGTGWLRLGNESTDLTGGVMLFGNSTSGENREFRVYGYNTATSLSNYGGLKYDDTYDALVVKTDTGHIQIGDAGSTTLTTPTNDDLFISGRMQTLGESYLMGNVGIGITSPGYKLDVAGTLKAGIPIVGSAGTGTGTVTCESSTSVTGSGTIFTTELAAGSIITAMGESFIVDFITNDIQLILTTPCGMWDNDSFDYQSSDYDSHSSLVFSDSLLISGNIGDTPTSGSGTRLMWISAKGAFRVGRIIDHSDYWDDANIGIYSFAYGQDTKASAQYSFAGGYRNIASGYESFVAGRDNTASGSDSGVFGSSNTASGSGSFVGGGYGVTASGLQSAAFNRQTTSGGTWSAAFGQGTTTNYLSFSLGRYNVGGGTADIWVATDPLFEIGIGTGTTAKDNALTVLKNGNVGIGTTNPAQKLDVVGLAGDTAVVSISTTSGNTCTFSTTTGSFSCASDIRLKNDIVEILGTDALSKLTEINPVTFHYNWQDENDSLVSGFIAQDFEKVFPEMVSTNSTTGYKSLSYAPLVPYLVQAIQELDIKISNLEKGTIASPTETINDYGEYASLFFSDILVKVENGIAYMKNLVLDTLTVGNPSKPTGITIYDKNGQAGCLEVEDVNTGIVNLKLGTCDSQISSSATTTTDSDGSSQSNGDIVAPVITLNGDSPINLVLGDIYDEEGATALDDIDGIVAVTISGGVDVSIDGTYVITYSTIDTAGNSATTTRMVIVGTGVTPVDSPLPEETQVDPTSVDISSTEELPSDETPVDTVS